MHGMAVCFTCTVLLFHILSKQRGYFPPRVQEGIRFHFFRKLFLKISFGCVLDVYFIALELLAVHEMTYMQKIVPLCIHLKDCSNLMVDLIPTISNITITLSGFNTNCQTILRKDLSIYCLQEM